MKGRYNKIFEAGWYSLLLNSGTGDGAGDSGNSGGAGGTAKYSHSIFCMPFLLKKTQVIWYKVGGNGGPGGNGKTISGGTGGGGGSGSGEESALWGEGIYLSTQRMKAGAGGDGGGNAGGGGWGGPNGLYPDWVSSGYQGVNGEDQPDGTPGGRVLIYKYQET
jgi:hypothetical protein